MTTKLKSKRERQRRQPLRAARGSVCPVADAVALQVLKRAERGVKKYGVNAARQDLSPLDWLQHLQEELLDAAVYVERLKMESTLNDGAMPRAVNNPKI